jgi:signal transduction histidine kinase
VQHAVEAECQGAKDAKSVMVMSELLNLIGLIGGLALYAMLLAMVVRDLRTQRSGSADPLLLATAILGLIWNLCALPTYELPMLGLVSRFRWLTAVGLGALGFLPAVVVHSVLRGEGRNKPRLAAAFLAVAYGVSTAAAVSHLSASWSNAPLPSVFAMRLLTFTFIGLLIPLAAVRRGQPGSRRALWVAALSIFAVSALHLSQSDRGDTSWIVELVGHHASLPLALAILYQDFPFAFADLFLKRALTLIALMVPPFVTFGILGVRSGAGDPIGDPRNVAVFVTLWIATALLYPYLRHGIGWFVDAVVLQRPDYEALRTEMNRAVHDHDDVPTLLDAACAALAPALSARTVRWAELRDAASQEGLEIPVAEPPRYVLHVGELTGGRRLLSDDRAFLAAITSLLGRRIDAIRITRERYQREMREQEMSQLATEAELRALRSQMNPHFLFNALTTVGYLIQTAPARALETLLQLTSLLRGVLRSEGELTTLGRELDLIEAYLEIERARFEQRLRVRIDVAARLKGIRVPPLVLQPLVENAIKHGIGPERHGGEVVVSAQIEDADTANPVLVLTVRDSGAGVNPADLQRGRQSGVGLKNIERRLACQYGTAGSLTFASSPGLGTTVRIRMPAQLTVPEDAGQRTA